MKEVGESSTQVENYEKVYFLLHKKCPSQQKMGLV